jgi:hypothetical protein
LLTFCMIGTVAAPWHGASWRCARRVFGLVLLAVALLGLAPPAARAQGVELTTFELVRGDEGVLLSFAVAFALPKAVEEALLKGVPLHFQAEADVMQNRWYWRDRRIVHAVRTWRLTYQPLTRKFRLGFGGLNQHYDQLDDALASLRRSTGWKIAEAAQIDDDERHYVMFSFRLDTSQLPRPMQIGIGGQPDWSLAVERTQRLN